MIPFNLTTLSRATPLTQRKAKTLEIIHRKTLQNLTQCAFIVSAFNQISCHIFKTFSPTTALRHFQSKARAERNSQFTIDEDQQMETQLINLSSEESDIASPCSSPIPQLPNNVPDTYSAVTQLIAAQHEQMSLSGTSAPQYPTTPPTSLTSDDINDGVLTPNNWQSRPVLTLYSKSPLYFSPIVPTNNTHPRYAGISDSRKSWAIRHLPSLRYSQRTVINFIRQPPNVTTVADGLRNLTLHPHPQGNEWVTGCLVCGKSYDQVIEETVANYINQTAQPFETVRERQI